MPIETNREPNKIGTVMGLVAGHGGDVWWVKHEDGTVSAYMFTEFETIEKTKEDLLKIYGQVGDFF